MVFMHDMTRKAGVIAEGAIPGCGKVENRSGGRLAAENRSGDRLAAGSPGGCPGDLGPVCGGRPPAGNPPDSPGDRERELGGAGPPVLRLCGVTKHFGELCALDRIDLAIDKGEIFGLLGPNGAGKTTLISIIAGLVRRSSGSVEVMGYDLQRQPLQVRSCIGLVPQELNYDPFFNVNEVLRFSMGYFGRRPDQARIDELLAILDLQEKKHTNTRALSGGMKRRLMIAKALVHDPPLVFLDEPTAGVDVELREELWHYIGLLRGRGTTIVLTTHYMEEAERLADRIGILHRGKLVRTGTRDELLREFGEQVLVFEVDRPPSPLPPGLRSLGVEPGENGNRLVYRYQQGQGSGVNEVLAALALEGLSVRQIHDRHTRLEDVFLKIIGLQSGRRP